MDLPAEVRKAARAALAQPDARESSLVAWLLAHGHGYTFDAGLVSVRADLRWVAASAPEGPEWPVLDLRRWPGDSAAMVYALRGAGREAPPELEGASWTEKIPRPEGDACWRGTLRPEGGSSREAFWCERDVEGVGASVGVLLLPGHGGLGPEGHAALVRELLELPRYVEPRPQAFRALLPSLAAGRLRVPPLGGGMEEGDEKAEPWQIVNLSGATLGLPPGLYAIRLSPDYQGPYALEDAELWFRGRFIDAAGRRVVVGDAVRGGAVRRVQDPGEAWRRGEGGPEAPTPVVRKARVAYGVAREWTGAIQAWAERWEERGGPTWLVFRLDFGDWGLQIDIPVREGADSESLFWIPASWRPPGAAPAPPPVDPASRFGISFDRFGQLDRRRHPWSEGYLSVPGMRLELPRDWWPVVALRSSDGFPVQLVDGSRRAVVRLRRLPASHPWVSALREGGENVSDWSRAPGRRHGGFLRYDGPSGSLLVHPQGFAFYLERTAEVQDVVWTQLVSSAVAVKTAPSRNRPSMTKE